MGLTCTEGGAHSLGEHLNLKMRGTKEEAFDLRKSTPVCEIVKYRGLSYDVLYLAWGKCAVSGMGEMCCIWHGGKCAVDFGEK